MDISRIAAAVLAGFLALSEAHSPPALAQYGRLELRMADAFVQSRLSAADSDGPLRYGTEMIFSAERTLPVVFGAAVARGDTLLHPSLSLIVRVEPDTYVTGPIRSGTGFQSPWDLVVNPLPALADSTSNPIFQLGAPVFLDSSTELQRLLQSSSGIWRFDPGVWRRAARRLELGPDDLMLVLTAQVAEGDPLTRPETFPLLIPLRRTDR